MENPMSPPNVPLPPEADAALRAGRKIEAIRLYREATGECLKESKDAVETYEAVFPELPPRPVWRFFQ